MPIPGLGTALRSTVLRGLTISRLAHDARLMHRRAFTASSVNASGKNLPYSDAEGKESESEKYKENDSEEGKKDVEDIDEGDTVKKDESTPSSSSAESSDTPTGESQTPPSDIPPAPSAPSSPGSIAKQSVLLHYPNRHTKPLRHHRLKEMMKRGQPYLGAFLLKDPNADADIVTDLDQVHPVGVFAQITSAFLAKNADGEDREGLTAVLYPHRRIRITELVKAGDKEEVDREEAEKPQTVEPPAIPTPPVTPPPETEEGEKKAKESMPFAPTSLLHKFPISIVNIENLTTLPYNKDDYIDQIASNVSDKLAEFAAAVSTGVVQELQDVLESLSVPDRLRNPSSSSEKNSPTPNSNPKLLSASAYYLIKQLKNMKELGIESDGNRIFDEELAKLKGLEPAAS
ncbi:ATP-dependent protease La domain-containing protein [Cyathus striatus]|nr:ATP-dependent protease La domain-containing protein [Cyathus striatus]